MRSMWLVYDGPRAARNQWMIKQYLTTATRYGLQATLVLADEPLAGRLPSSLPDLALFRCVAPQLRARLEDCGVAVHNGTELARVANDKWATYQYFHARGVPVMRTQLAPGHTMAPPFVVKPRGGHGGEGVERVTRATNVDDDSLIVQELADSPGVDLRVYLLGGQVQAAMLRTSTTSFKSNYSLGGSARTYSLHDDELARLGELIKVAPILTQGLCGVDFIRHQDGWVLNEVEDVVGMRMVYSLTQLDLVDKHLRYLAEGGPFH
ncbi:ATP-grasp domain-containing protein [Corynebacterium pilosum]|uniref:Alpha-aminoadipate--lysW ligase lysX n=1 Tax=Corynebacterium pilosum TaxID=35756 RepID=A0A376CJG4_9CORY|nr:ATP-grasp domain-containing protein [Corynebacterium pilosum]STC68636.1 Alpha-aminoadipate--lysW ligase lysX [Corynebacterium pilosum]